MSTSVDWKAEEDTCPGSPSTENLRHNGQFIGVYVPGEVELAEDAKLVYVDKVEALKFVKKYKRARFKAFDKLSDAVGFSKYGSDPSFCDSPGAIQEKSSPFKSPKPQELVKLRKGIESGDHYRLVDMVESNPRFLVSSGDTPAILQEGPRYNALHIAAKCNNFKAVDFLLGTISKYEFIRKLYGDNGIAFELCMERCEKLLDLYLNTPDKALNETPLHFAVKIGALEVVKILVSFPSCDKTRLNKFNKTPGEIICSRLENYDPEIFIEIQELLTDQFYVPVMSPNGFSHDPVVGTPMVFTSPEKPVVSLQAWAGPMDQEAAVHFRKMWYKSPERSAIIRQAKLYDPQKGLELVGRNLAQMKNVRWAEYWPFLGAFADLRTPSGLKMLESYLERRVRAVASSDGGKRDHEVRSLGKPKLSEKSMDIDFHELNEVVDVVQTVRSPVSELCVNFSKMTIGSKESPKSNGSVFTTPKMDKMCQVFATRIASTIIRNCVQGFCKEISHLTHFLLSCSHDLKFKDIQMNMTHSKVAHMVAETVGVTDEESAKVVLFMISQGPPNNEIHEVFNCILKKVLRFMTSSEIEEHEKCKCFSKRPHKPRRRINFATAVDDEIGDGKSVEAVDYDGFNSDSSDDNYHCSFSDVSDELLPSAGSDDDFHDAQSLPEVYLLNNDYPTVQDADVLQVLSAVEISDQKYPFISYWKDLCRVYSEKVQKDNWVKVTFPVKTEEEDGDDIECSPSWHRSRIVRARMDSLSSP